MKEQEKIESGLYLPMIEDFYTLQGEGFHTGKAAYFVRLGGCDIECDWCDTRISWDASTKDLTSIEDIVSKVAAAPAKAIVVTGGEPLLYNLSPLCDALNEESVETYLETSGAHDLTGEWDWICLSPKRNHPPLNDIFILANELKVIIANKDDFKWAEENAAKVDKTCHLFLQPEWSNFEEIMPVIVEYVLHNPKWQVSLQAHKFMRIP